MWGPPASPASLSQPHRDCQGTVKHCIASIKALPQVFNNMKCHLLVLHCHILLVLVLAIPCKWTRATGFPENWLFWCMELGY